MKNDDMSTQWSDAIADWCAWLAAAGRPATTRALRRHQVQRLAAAMPCGPWQVTTDHLVRWLTGQGWAPETMRSHRAAAGTFYRWAVDTGRVATSPAASLPAIKPAEHHPRPATDAAVAAALLAADRRTRLMIVLAAREGLRRGEVARVHSEDVTEDLAGWSLRVHGKGGKTRVIPLAEDVAAELRAAPAGYLFPGQDAGHLSPAYVGRLMSRVLPEGWTPHTLRHRFATRTYAGTRDLLAVQALLGHSRPETTRAYVRLPDDALRAALGYAA